MRKVGCNVSNNDRRKNNSFRILNQPGLLSRAANETGCRWNDRTVADWGERGTLKLPVRASITPQVIDNWCLEAERLFQSGMQSLKTPDCKVGHFMHAKLQIRRFMHHLELFCFERPYGNCNQARSYLTNKDKPTDIGTPAWTSVRRFLPKFGKLVKIPYQPAV